jgi:hypothetical protein
MTAQGKAVALWGALALTLVLTPSLAGCGRSEPAAARTASAPTASTDSADPGYRGAPQITQLSRGAGGTFSLSGRAMPSSQVRLASPGGQKIETTADGQGVWRVELGLVSEPAVYGLSAEADGRRVQAEGYVAVVPGAPTAALLRAGAGAWVLNAQPGLRLLAVDMDGGGATVASGRAPSGASVRVLVDGAAAIQGPAATDGRFSLALPKDLSPGPHRLEVVSGRETASTAIVIGPIAPPTDLPYRASPLDGGGWRLDWITPGQGLQATLLLGAGEAPR